MKPKKRRNYDTLPSDFAIAVMKEADRKDAKPRLSRKSAATVRRVTKAVAESRKRMNTYTPAERIALEQYARDLARTSQALDLSSPREMLRTLKAAYRHALDDGAKISALESGIPVRKPRLSVTEQRDLGRRLAQYWSMKEEDL